MSLSDLLGLELAAPMWLSLLVVVAALAAWDVARGWGPSPGRRIGAAAVRALLLAAFVLALAQPRWNRRDDVSHVVFVVDRSASISDQALAAALARVESVRATLPDHARVGLVVFDALPEIAVVPGEPWVLPQPLRETPAEVTDVESALALALGLVPADDGGEIVLVSDGRQTSGARTGAAIASATERGVAVHVLPIEPGRRDPAVNAVVLTDSDVRPGATMTGHVEVDGSDQPVRATLRVKVGTELALEQAIEVPAGQTIEVPFTHEVDRRAPPGTLTVEAELVPDAATSNVDVGNDRAAATVVVGEPPKVRVFSGEDPDGNALARALRAERMDVEVVKAAAGEAGAQDLTDVDLVVLANAPATAIGGERGLPTEFLDRLGRYVDSGGGLVVLGGPLAFDLGGYAGTPLERVLPVRLDPVDPEVDVAATIVIVLDRSGSMAATVGFSKTKMELADEGAVASIRMLRPFDRVGVMSVTEEVSWEVPVQPVADAFDLERKVMRIRADGGGIFVYTALEAARAAMKRADTPLRHVILFSDCADSEEKVKGVPFGEGTGPRAEDLAKQMRADNITTSVIGIGTDEDVDTQFLKDLAKSGGGRFYLTDDATKLRSLFVEETERLVDTSIKEGNFRPDVRAAHPMIAGMDYPGGPMLRGFQELEPRSTAEIVLEAPAGKPLLTTWRYGLGHVVVWASDAGPRWAQDWLQWAGYSRQWTQIARFALRSRAGDDTAIEIDMAGSDAVVRIVRRDAKGLTIDEGGVRARIKSSDQPRDLALRSPEPGRWEARAATESGKLHTVEVLDASGRVLAEHAFVPPPSAERRHRTADRPWLDELTTKTGGLFDPERIEPTAAASITTDVRRLWPLLAMLAIVLLPLDAFLRRPARVA